MKKVLHCFSLVLLTALIAPNVLADKQHNTLGDIGAHVFSAMEREVLRDYYHGEKPVHHKVHKKHGGKKGKGLPPGLAKRDTLPPGLAKKHRLPPGLERQTLPAELEHRLPPVRDGFERAIIAGSIVLIEIATDVVFDIVEGIFD